jgi:RNA polymerase sigma factor (sigma-70 family)
MNLGIPYSKTEAANQSAVKDYQSEFIQMVTTNQGIIHKVCNLYCDSQEERRDLFQEITLQLWKGFKAYEGRAKLSTWMYRVALNTAISSFRKRKRRPEEQALGEFEMQLPNPPEDPDKAEKIRFLYKAIGKLSKVEKAIIMLYLEEHSYDEIAEIVGITRNHVGVKINRIKGKLKKVLQPHFS